MLHIKKVAMCFEPFVSIIKFPGKETGTETPRKTASTPTRLHRSIYGEGYLYS